MDALRDVAYSDRRATATNANENIDLAAILNALSRGKYWIIVTALVFAVVTGFYAERIAVPKYIAAATIQLDMTGAQIVDLGVALPDLGGSSEAINTEVEVLKSRRLAERVVRAEALLEDPEFNSNLRDKTRFQQLRAWVSGRTDQQVTDEVVLARVVDNLLATVSIKGVSDTFVLRISVKTEHAEKSARLANAFAREYIQYSVDIGVEETVAASTWLSERAAQLKIEYERADARVAAFSTRTEVLSEADFQGLELRLKLLRERLDQARTTLAASEARVLALQDAVTGSPRAKVEAAQDARLTELFESGAPEGDFDARFERVLAEARAQSETDRTQVDSLAGAVVRSEAEVEQQTQELFELAQLRREAESSRLLYEYFLVRLNETSAKEGLQQATSRFLSDATAPVGPVEPKSKQMVALGLIFGGLLGSLIAILRNRTGGVFLLAEDLSAATGIPVMGKIPQVKIRSRGGVLKYVVDNPMSALSESIRNMRTSVTMSRGTGAPGSILVTSAIPGDGKTTVSFSLAQNFTGLGARVLLIEGDIRRNVFSAYVDAPQEAKKTLPEAIKDSAPISDAAFFDEKLGFDVIFGGLSDDNPADLYASAAFKAFIERAKAEYDLVVIDTPPVLLVADARIIAPHVDTVLMVTRWNRTTSRQVHDAIESFHSVGDTVDGLVLNGIDQNALGKYGYGDAAYTSYGKHYYTT